MEPINDVDATVDGNRFRSLSEHVIHHIFSFLETIEVTRASCVSTEWRRLWTSMPHFNFDYKEIWEDGEFRSTVEYDKYKEFINWVLMSHDNSVSIQSFRLSCLNNKDDYSLYRWLHILAQNHVQQLYLRVRSDSMETFTLPHCLLASGSLEVLELDLRESALSIPRHAGFSRLKSLHLVDTCLFDPISFGNFISSCPLLENLKLRCELYGFKSLDISLENLRKLVIYCECTKFELKVACPNLVYFYFNGPLLQNLYWDKAPSLKTAIILPAWPLAIVPNEELAYCLLKILREFCHVEILNLHMRVLEFVYPTIAEQGCFPITFHNLKSLTLTERMYRNCYFQSVICLLKCVPNLQLLSFNPMYIGYGTAYRWNVPFPDEDIVCLRNHLKTVKLLKIDTDDHVVEMIRFFLKNGHALEEMSITWQICVESESRLEAMQKIMKFPRSSSYVTVSFPLS